MQITSYYTNPVFGARKKEIKDADHIERKTRQTFPMISHTYLRDVCSISKPNSKYSNKSSYLLNNLERKIDDMRNLYPPSYVDENVIYTDIIKKVKQRKIGNCKENAKAAVAVLCANGYYNSQRAELMYRVNFINKETGETEYSNIYPLDHSFAVTDMKKDTNINSGKRNIVIDPWLGFSDSKEGAIARYKQLYGKKDYSEAISVFKGIFCCSKKMNYGDFAEKYNIEGKMEFRPTEKYATDYQLRKLGEWTRKNFNGVIIDELKDTE
ncbi:MAG: hypothetical protein LUE64_06810 [Candidatus Gastranaerophilales bacterium]|nr:hypothetical protein [Candidatus Gastranaerophilales bacterium]